MNGKPYALITGATGGLGKAFAFHLARNGYFGERYNLLLTGRSDDKLQTLKNDILSNDENLIVEVFPCDLTDSSDRTCFFDYVASKNVKIGMLLNVAGVDTQKAFTKYTEEKLVFQSRVLFEATVSVTRFVLAQNSDDLKILTISSICGITPMPYFAIYSSLKGALKSFFDALRFELKDRKNVVITTVLPGSIPTRKDIIEDIEKQGITGKLSKKPVDYIVKKSFCALRKRKKNYTPGTYNKLVAFFGKPMPNGIKMRIVANKFRNKEKDAF